MKKITLMVLAIFLACGYAFAGCGQGGAQAAGKESGYPVIEFENDTHKHDFGKVVRGESVSHVFRFRNTGKAPLVIADVATSCGCTTPEYTLEPVMPGKYGQVKVTFDGEGFGRFTKSVTLTLNTRESREVLYITGQIVDKK